MDSREEFIKYWKWSGTCSRYRGYCKFTR